MSLPWAVGKTEFYLASCRCLPHPDRFALLANSIHSILCCHISAHQRCFATNKMWCLRSASLCLHPRGLLLIRSSFDLYRSPPRWAIAFSESLFITFDLSSGDRCHYQVWFSDFSAQSSCRDSSEGLHVCSYNDRLLFVFLFCTFIGKKKLLSFVIFALRPNVGVMNLFSWPWTLSICFLANVSISTEDQTNS